MSEAVAIEDLAVHFAPRQSFGRARPSVRAVDGVSFSVAAGETLGLVGESGCGKSTLANAILGLVPATRGSILVNGRQVVGAPRSTLAEIWRDAQMVFQDPVLSLNPRMSVGAALREPLQVRGVAKGKELEARIGRLLQSVGLRPEHAKLYPHQFSGGQKQRIVIARAIALEPALVICDEPVSALDVSVRAQILNLLVRLQRERGMAYLFVSHDLSVVRHVTDRVAVMYLGKIVELAGRDILFGAPKHPYTQALLRAVPEADPVRQRAKSRTILRGELPSPSNIPSGCAFHTRCPLASDICRKETPLLTPRDDGARVACHHA